MLTKFSYTAEEAEHWNRPRLLEPANNYAKYLMHMHFSKIVLFIENEPEGYVSYDSDPRVSSWFIYPEWKNLLRIKDRCGLDTLLQTLEISYLDFCHIMNATLDRNRAYGYCEPLERGWRASVLASSEFKSVVDKLKKHSKWGNQENRYGKI
jgi:hypothetical protein